MYVTQFVKVYIIGDFVLVNIVLKLHRYIILESNVKPFYLVKFTTWYIYDISLWIQKVKEWLVFFIFFCLTNWIRKEMKFHIELQYSVYSCILPHTFTSLYQLIFSDPRNKRVETSWVSKYIYLSHTKLILNKITVY